MVTDAARQPAYQSEENQNALSKRALITVNLDEGPTIAQDCFPIRSGMRLVEIIKKGQKGEAKALVKAVPSYLAKSFEVSWRVVNEV